MEKISVIVPCHNEQEALNKLNTEVTQVLETLNADYELLFIDDGSTDATLEIIKGLAESNPKIRFISFSRNFGKEAAIYAGLENFSGDLAVVMDADLQHPPELIPQMYEAIEQGYDMCVTKRTDRAGEPAIRSFFARRFYKFINKISDIKIEEGAQDFCMMKRVVAESILQIKETNRFTKGIYCWVGFKKKWLEHDNIQRGTGKSKWSFWSLVKYSLEGIVSFSTMPLMISSLFGFIFCLIALLLVVVVCVKTIFFGEPVQGFPTLICGICLIGGIIMLGLGILGQYVAKMYLEAKNRPIYLVREKSD